MSLLAALSGFEPAARGGGAFNSGLLFFFGAGFAGAAFALGLAAFAGAGFAVFAAGFGAALAFVLAAAGLPLAAGFAAALAFAGADLVALVLAVAAFARVPAGFAAVLAFAGVDLDLGAFVILLAIVFPVPSLSSFQAGRKTPCLPHRAHISYRAACVRFRSSSVEYSEPERRFGSYIAKSSANPDGRHRHLNGGQNRPSTCRTHLPVSRPGLTELPFARHSSWALPFGPDDGLNDTFDAFRREQVLQPGCASAFAGIIYAIYITQNPTSWKAGRKKDS
ncbi:MAG: hypothetical protein RLO15_07500 [Parvibaculum sp.]